MVVIVIVGILAAITLPNLGGVTETGHDISAQPTVQAISKALHDEYIDADGHYPTNADGVTAVLTAVARREPDFQIRPFRDSTAAAYRTAQVTPAWRDLGNNALPAGVSRGPLEASVWFDSVDQVTVCVRSETDRVYCQRNDESASLQVSAASGNTRPEFSRTTGVDETSARTALATSAQPARNVGTPLAAVPGWNKLLDGTELGPEDTLQPPVSGESAPALSGLARQNEMLTATAGDWVAETFDVTYQWERCNATGGACAPIPGATTPSYTIKVADLDRRLRVSVTASNRVGQSEPRYSEPTRMVAGIWDTMASSKDADGIVRLRGEAIAVANYAHANNTTNLIGTLPPEHRPAKRLLLSTPGYGNGGGSPLATRFDIWPTGEIRLVACALCSDNGTSGGRVSLRGIEFPAANAGAWQTGLLSSAFRDYDNSIFAPAGTFKDAHGVVHVRGLASSVVSFAAGYTVMTLPAAHRPAQEMLVDALMYDTSLGYRIARLDVNPDGNVSFLGAAGGYSGSAGSWIALDGLVFPSAAVTWTALALPSNWSNWGAPQEAAGYTKTPDGVAYTRGLLRNSSAFSFASSPLRVTLPAAIRPISRSISGQIAYDTNNAAYLQSFQELRPDGTLTYFGSIGGPNSGSAGSFVSIADWHITSESSLQWTPLARNAAVWGNYTAVPSVAFTSGPAQPSTYDVQSGAVTWTATNEPETTECSLDGAPFTPCSSGITLSFSNNNGAGHDHVFRVRVSNSAGGSGTYSYQWRSRPNPVWVATGYYEQRATWCGNVLWSYNADGSPNWHWTCYYEDVWVSTGGYWSYPP